MKAETDREPRLSIIVPIYNEAATIRRVIELVQLSLRDFTYEIILVDDGSTDGGTATIQDLARNEGITAIAHSTNQGKGAALRSAFDVVLGEIIVIQDADLEYNPNDIVHLIQPILDNRADVVYGSRLCNYARCSQSSLHRLANRWLTRFSNFLNNLDITDMETGYKAFRRSAIQSVTVRENRFGVEPELTAKFAKLKCRIYEVPICYHGRDYSQGKRIGALDALRAVWCIMRYRIVD